MLYPKNQRKQLEDKLFRNPGSEYRGAPFWAWNSTLEEAQLMEQIGYFKKMGFGGFHMHVRQGLETEYMGKQFLDMVRACVRKAQEEGMYAWLYDEDRWPSGCAGGKVTADVRYRLRYLLMTKRKPEDCAGCYREAYLEGKPLFLGAFRIVMNGKGIVTGYEKLSSEEESDAGNCRFFYCMTEREGQPRYNYQTYSDTMSGEAVDKFLEETHEAYKDVIGDFFGSTVPAIFTDEPQMKQAIHLENGFSGRDAILPFTLDFPDTFQAENGYALTDRLPELFYACSFGQAKKTRYDYYRHVNLRFHSAYADNIGKWCQKNGIMLTGHAMGEDSLEEMACYGYEAMRLYQEMELPGIDMLFDDRMLTTAIQCRSAVRQYDREGMMSELYGVTGWDFDFRGHKFQGDWQACMGVTVRVPHLAWQSMKGEGKRDYPASVFYQSPWFEEYKYLEDDYARINTALSRGRAVVRTAVIHPIESYWMERASEAETLPVCREYDEHFKQLAEWLIRGLIDFDYLSESQLPKLCREAGAPLQVGQMRYDVIIVCDCVTLRPHTLSLLEGFRSNGGKLIFMGKKPAMCDGVKSDRAAEIAEAAVCLDYSRTALLAQLEEYRDVEIRDVRGAAVTDLMYTLRQDSGRKWLFLAHMDRPELKHIVNEKKLTVKIKGAYKPVLYNPLTGEIGETAYRICTVEEKNREKGEEIGEETDEKTGRGGENKVETCVYARLYDTDTLLLALDPVEAWEAGTGADAETRGDESFGVDAAKIDKAFDMDTIETGRLKSELYSPYHAAYTLSEPNVLLLDMAAWRLNGGPWNGEEEILRIDRTVRTRLGLENRGAKKVVQPYVIRDTPEENVLELRYRILSEAEFDNGMLALENPEKCEIFFNREKVLPEPVGYYVDKDIQAVKLGKIQEGENFLTINMRFGLGTDLEACYLLGDFGTRYCGRQQFLCRLPGELYFGSVVNQGLAFYGGNITYHTEIVLEEQADLEIEVTDYAGALIKVTLDDTQTKCLIFSPYRIVFEKVGAGRHTIAYELFGNRYNTFSALHTLLADQKRIYMGSDYWRSTGDGWAYEYQTRPFGILKTPVIRKAGKTV